MGINMDYFRKVFDTIPEQFDKYRKRYCKEAFYDIISLCTLNASKSVLEIGPGTGQATEPILQTGCDYHAIELGENLAAFCKEKFSGYGNFHIVNDDFVTHDFAGRQFDLIYSAATIQWIPEKQAFPKVHELLKDGGTLAMLLQRGDYRTPNEALFNDIQKVYSAYFHPENPYTCRLEYENVVNYGFTGFEKREYHVKLEFTAEQYLNFISTHSDHILLKDPERTLFFDGIRDAINAHGEKLVSNDTVVLYLARKGVK